MENMEQILPPIDRPLGPQAAQLRKILNTMFPHSYIELYHRPPHSVCSILKTKTSQESEEELLDNWRLEASSEPAGRAQVLSLQRQLQDSLAEHQAKPVGLCPIRRAIYDQCFDELIRQVTVSCVEQGLLLFQVRNELRLTISYYRRAYESAIGYGLRKSLDAELKIYTDHQQMQNLDDSVKVGVQSIPINEEDGHQVNSFRAEDDQVERIKLYYESELAKKDSIIRQQREVMKSMGIK